MDTPEPAFGSLRALLQWCRSAPRGTALDAREVARLLSDLIEREGGEPGDHPSPAPAPEAPPFTWRERLWLVPAETRLGVPEVAEAVGRPKSWVYARTHRFVGKGKHRRERPAAELIPHRKLDGALVFTAGEVRAWLRDREEAVVGGPMHSTEAERRGLHLA
jgi:hypothetical protein